MIDDINFLQIPDLKAAKDNQTSDKADVNRILT